MFRLIDFALFLVGRADQARWVELIETTCWLDSIKLARLIEIRLIGPESIRLERPAARLGSTWLGQNAAGRSEGQPVRCCRLSANTLCNV